MRVSRGGPNGRREAQRCAPPGGSGSTVSRCRHWDSGRVGSCEAEMCALSCMSVMFQWKASGGNSRRGAGQRWAREVRGPDARRQGAAAAPPAVRTGASRGPCRWHCRQGGALPGRHGGGRGSPAEGRDAATPVTPDGAPSTQGAGRRKARPSLRCWRATSRQERVAASPRGGCAAERAQGV